jgi:PIN domain nuclease of toxin-antitoxin system
MKYLLDTHVWIWWNMNPAKLSRRVRTLVSSPETYEELILSAISPWEFAKLVEKGRIGISIDPESWIDQAMAMPKLRLAPLTPVVACRSTLLPRPFHDDPADQIIVATARDENATILTIDEKIRAYPHVKSLW